MNNIDASQLQQRIDDGYYTVVPTVHKLERPTHLLGKFLDLFYKPAEKASAGDLAEIARLVDDYNKELAAYQNDNDAYYDLVRNRTQEFWRDCSVAAGTYSWGESLLALIRQHVENMVGMTDSAARGPTWNLKWEIYQDVVELLKLARANAYATK